MTPEDVIREIEESASEWIEMSENPSYLIAGILAKKIIALNSHIEYLERRLEYDSRNKSTVCTGNT